MYSRALSHADWLCNTACDNILETLEDRRLEVVSMKDDIEEEIGRTATYKLEELREQVEKVGDDGLSEMEQKADEICDDTKEHLNELVRKERAWIEQETGWLGWQKEVLKRDMKRFEDMKRALELSTADDRSRRAQSASL